MRETLRSAWPILVIAVLTVAAFNIWMFSLNTGADPEPAGPTGLTTTTVNMPSGRMVECVFARDATTGGVAVALDCDFGR